MTNDSSDAAATGNDARSDIKKTEGARLPLAASQQRGIAHPGDLRPNARGHKLTGEGATNANEANERSQHPARSSDLGTYTEPGAPMWLCMFGRNPALAGSDWSEYIWPLLPATGRSLIHTHWLTPAGVNPSRDSRSLGRSPDARRRALRIGRTGQQRIYLPGDPVLMLEPHDGRHSP